ncbi:hypothetical protein J7M02_06835 [Candidatus Aerophobetes bacterium]|nr:hypothetical protein [Candidatus Aerophobetes bacterium]
MSISSLIKSLKQELEKERKELDKLLRVAENQEATRDLIMKAIKASVPEDLKEDILRKGVKMTVTDEFGVLWPDTLDLINRHDPDRGVRDLLVDEEGNRKFLLESNKRYRLILIAVPVGEVENEG